VSNVQCQTRNVINPWNITAVTAHHIAVVFSVFGCQFGEIKLCVLTNAKLITARRTGLRKQDRRNFFADFGKWHIEKVFEKV